MGGGQQGELVRLDLMTESEGASNHGRLPGEKKVVDKVKIVFLIDEGFFRVRQ